MARTCPTPVITWIWYLHQTAYCFGGASFKGTSLFCCSHPNTFHLLYNRQLLLYRGIVFCVLLDFDGANGACSAWCKVLKVKFIWLYLPVDMKSFQTGTNSFNLLSFLRPNGIAYLLVFCWGRWRFYSPLSFMSIPTSTYCRKWLRPSKRTVSFVNYLCSYFLTS